MSTKTNLILLVMTVVLGTSCASDPGQSAPNENRPTPLPSQATIRTWTADEANRLCDRIPEIKILPLKRDRGVDKTYDDFVNAGNVVVPCLIEKVSDDTKIPDPREAPGYPDIQVRVGDIAYFILLDITKLPFTELLPRDVSRAYEDEGVYAYFQFVKTPRNRKHLQDSLRTWYQNNHKER